MQAWRIDRGNREVEGIIGVRERLCGVPKRSVCLIQTYASLQENTSGIGVEIVINLPICSHYPKGRFVWMQLDDAGKSASKGLVCAGCSSPLDVLGPQVCVLGESGKGSAGRRIRIRRRRRRGRRRRINIRRRRFYNGKRIGMEESVKQEASGIPSKETAYTLLEAVVVHCLEICRASRAFPQQHQQI